MALEWPILQPASDGETFALLHLASQMLGKLRLRHSTWENHGWHLTLRPRADGLAILPTPAGDGRTFTLGIDLCAHGIALKVSDGASDLLPFAGRTIAGLHADVIDTLARRGLPTAFNGIPNEVEGAVPFARDDRSRSYNPDSASRLLEALNRVVPVFERFRAGFAGKGSPVHFFWGSFDLAVTRFSGRTAPEHPGGIPGLPDRVTREAYSHEVSSAGFWPGGVVAADPIFYSYAYPEPAGFRETRLEQGSFDETLGEFALPYSQVREADDPEAMLLGFFQATYEAAARAAEWDRAALERSPVAP